MWRRLRLPAGLFLRGSTLRNDRRASRAKLPRKKPEISDWENEGGAPRPADVPPETENTRQ